MQLGFVGLGRMGGNMVTRLRRDDHDVVAFDVSPDAVAAAQAQGAHGADSLAALVAALAPPRHIWIMVPSGDAVQQTLDALAELVDPGDLLVDGGNSNFHDTQRRGTQLAERGIRFCDVGVSGGVWGLEVGYCMMSGGDAQDIEALRPALDTLAPPDGWLHVGPVGAGHYVKMVHNGIEYGMLQAYGEGFEILRNAQFELDLGAISHLWNQGSVVRSWLLELAERAFARSGDLDGVRGFVDDSGEGRWTVAEAIEQSTPAPVLTLSLLARFASRQDESFSAKVIAALRNEFGGHAIHRE
ncbi:MAG: decarboxylating 6-phosphogluconate dehydrogenase [Conexibacter sp.]